MNGGDLQVTTSKKQYKEEFRRLGRWRTLKSWVPHPFHSFIVEWVGTTNLNQRVFLTLTPDPLPHTHKSC